MKYAVWSLLLCLIAGASIFAFVILNESQPSSAVQVNQTDPNDNTVKSAKRDSTSHIINNSASHNINDLLDDYLRGLQIMEQILNNNENDKNVDKVLLPISTGLVFNDDAKKNIDSFTNGMESSVKPLINQMKTEQAKEWAQSVIDLFDNLHNAVKNNNQDNLSNATSAKHVVESGFEQFHMNTLRTLATQAKKKDTPIWTSYNLGNDRFSKYEKVVENYNDVMFYMEKSFISNLQYPFNIEKPSESWFKARVDEFYRDKNSLWKQPNNLYESSIKENIDVVRLAIEKKDGEARKKAIAKFNESVVYLFDFISIQEKYNPQKFKSLIQTYVIN
jgi:hypothetical protein